MTAPELPKEGEVWEARRVRNNVVDQRLVLGVSQGGRMVTTQGRNRSRSSVATFMKAYRKVEQ